VGEEGTIMKTIDGGITWTTLSSGTTNILYSVYFTDANTGFAVGEEGTIMKTIDGGITWTTLSSGTTNILYSVYFTDANTGFAVGEAGTIVKTVNGGETWTDLSGIATYGLLSVYFTDANTGYIVGDFGTILKTTNGGGLFIEETPSPKTKFTIYPNPTNNKITIANISKSLEETIMTIYNVKGEQIMINKFHNQNLIEMNVSMLSKGIYLVKIQTKAGIESKKLVIQ